MHALRFLTTALHAKKYIREKRAFKKQGAA